MELWRRWILLLSTIVGIFLAMCASLSPKVSLKAVDFASSQGSEFGWDERTAYLQQLPLPEYIEEKTKDHQTLVQGEDWVTFFGDVLSASRDEAIAKRLQRHVYVENRWSSPPFQVFFLPSELPPGDVADQLRGTGGEPHYLILPGPDGKQYLEAVYQTYDSEDFGFGSGISNPPPASLLYPYRRIGFGMLALGVLVYILLPRRKRAPDAICYAHWTVVPGDFVGMLLFVGFFTLPMLVVGGAVQTITLAWFFPLILWPLAFLGAWLLIHMAEYAAYEIRVLDDGIELTTCRGQSTHRFAEMKSVQPLVLLTPVWLTRLSWLAAMARQGSDRFRMTGQAIALSNSAAHGMCLRKKDGSAVYAWVPGNASEKVFKNAGRLTDAIEAAGIPREEDAKVVRALVRPDGEAPDGSTLKQSQSKVLAGLIVLPLAVIGIGLVGWWGMDILDSIDIGSGSDSSWKDDLKRDTEAQFSSEKVAWEKRFRGGASPMLLAAIEESGGTGSGSDQGGQDTHACGFGQLADGSLLIYGCAGPSSYLDGYVLRTDELGEKQWENQYGVEGKACDYITGACQGRDGKILLLGTSGSYSTIMGGSRAYLVGISGSGEKQWDLLWGEGTDFPEPDAAAARTDGSFTVYGHSGAEPSTTIFLLHVGESGQLITERQIDAEKEIGGVDIRRVVPTQDGGFVATGEISEPDQYKNLLLAKFNSDGKLEWKRGFGGPKLESGRKVVQTTEGGLLAAGLIDTFDESVRLYLVRLDAQGDLAWEKTIGGKGQYELHDLQLAKDGGFLLAGDYRPDANSLPQLSVIKTDMQGGVDWEKHLEQPEVIYSGMSSIETTDGATIVLATRSWGNQDLNAISVFRLNQ